jgi:hypothetical protein
MIPGATTSRHTSPWRGPLVTGSIVVAAGMTISLAAPYSLFGIQFWVPPLGHTRVWITPTDFWWAERGAAYIADGAFGYVYQAARAYFGLPLFMIILAPFVLIARAFGLDPGEVTPGQIPHPHMWLVLGPVVLATVVPLLYATRRLMHRLGIERTLPTELLVVLLAFGPALWPGGHVEDVLALAFVLLAVEAALADRPILGAFFFSLAIATKQWSAIGVPLFIVLIPARQRVRAFLTTVAVPALLGAFVLLVDYRDASLTLLHAYGYVVQGRKAPFAISLGGPFVLTAPFRLAMFIVAGALAVALRHRLRPELVPAAFGVCYLSRFLLEPTPPAYYFAPALTFFLIDERIRKQPSIWIPVLGFVVVASFGLPGSTLWWSFVAVTSLVVAAPAIWNVCRAPAV